MRAIAYYTSPIGLIRLEAIDGQLRQLNFAQILEDDAIHEKELHGILTQLHRYFKGDSQPFVIPYSLQGTAFQQMVWQQVLLVPHGKTCSYESIAIALGDRKKIRAVANAIGKNPLPLIIPCHRVVGKNGDLTGYLGGLWRKQYLLDLEKIKTQPPLIPLLEI
jgi:methylated-DNA-[protein]-cysteine S-methyltransferase